MWKFKFCHFPSWEGKWNTWSRLFPISNFKLCNSGRSNGYPLDNPDLEIFTDGSSFDQDGERKACYTVVMAEQVLEAQSLPQGISAQSVELVALTQALELCKVQRVNIYTDLSMLIWLYILMLQYGKKGRTATGEPIKHFREINQWEFNYYASKSE